MTDFYSVLQTALSRVGAVDETARERIYGHVREVMIRKLQDLDPPLDEEQIASRLSTFDAAIERIEADVVQRQSAGDADAYEVDDEPAEEAAPAEEPEAPAYASSNGESEYRRSEAGWHRESEDDASSDAVSEEPEQEPGWGNPSVDALREPSGPRWSEDEGRIEPGFAAENGAAADDERYRPPTANGHDRAAASGWDRTADQYDDPRTGRAPRDESYWGVGGETQPVYTEESEQAEPKGWAAKLRPRGLFAKSAPADNAAAPGLNGAGAPPRQANGDGRLSRRQREPSGTDDPIAALARGLRGRAGQRAEPSLNEPPADAEPVPYQMEAGEIAPAVDDFGEPQPVTRKSRRAMRREAKEERRSQRKLTSGRRRIWILAILLVGAVVIGWAASVFIPILFPSGPEVEQTADAAAELPPAPVNAGPVTPVRTVTPETAGGPIMLFQGADPSVFEAAPDNPVQYEGDADTGFARITSSITSGGARAVIGPGVVEAIAGHSVRIVLEARGTPGQAATTVTLGYQHGETQLQSRAANLPAEFGAVAGTWAIPAGATGNDYLTIDPGVPGDGTAIDIRSIRIEILN